MKIPPLAPKIEKVLVKPKGPGDGGPIGPDLGMNFSGPIERFVTEDATIQRTIATTGAVTFGGQQIGPAGAVGNFNLTLAVGESIMLAINVHAGFHDAALVSKVYDIASAILGHEVQLHVRELLPPLHR